MARKKSVRFDTPIEWELWILGFDRMGRDIRRAGIVHWQIATEVFYSATQEYVHILSGGLLASGSYQVFAFETGRRIIGEVKYGGKKVKYAKIENNRGGEHAYMVRGWEATQAQFEMSINDSMRLSLAAFKGR